jgi:CCR4-NOT transcription complex subunit 3
MEPLTQAPTFTPMLPLESGQTGDIQSSLNFNELQGAGQMQTLQMKRKSVLDLLDASFRNMPTPQDQESIDPKHPSSVWEENNFPTVPLFNRKKNFAKFDIDTLFFAFYYQQGTY